MKRNFTSFVCSCLLISSLGAAGQVNENFNSRPGATLSQVKGYLQDRCWVINGFNTNEGWTPGIEGDGAMVSSSTSATATQQVGIYSQILDLPGELTVSFKYKISDQLPAGAERWIDIYLTSPDLINAGPAMERILIPSSAVPGQEYTFSKKLTPWVSGPYRVYLNYQGTGGNTRLAIDNLVINVPLYYPGGCNPAPVANDDNFNGAANRTASGDVTLNDSDPNYESFDTYLTEQSPDGTVVLEANGTFTFTPNPGFTGNSTTFKYRICDFGYAPTCSQDATVTITFANSMLPVTLVDFKGLYKDAGDVELTWATTFEQNSDRFDIERSLDGLKWEVVGSVKTGANSTVRKNYQFIDQVGRNTVAKKDVYYRLKQVDLDGRETRSRILIVRVYNTHALKMVSVSPNPAKNDIAVNVQLNEQSYIVMKVLNSNGAEVLRKSAKAGAGNNSYLMEGSSNLKPGMYVLEVTINSKERMIVKLIKE